MKYKKTRLGINRKIVDTFHKFMLIVMLHSSFVAPSQNLISDYFNNSKPIAYIGSNNIQDDRNQTSTAGKINNNGFLNNKNKATVKNANENFRNSASSNFKIESDIQSGVIGVSNNNPLDDATDNLFKFTIDNLPHSSAKVFLKYDLYGVQDLNAVSRSINERPATGGYLVKIQNAWTSQIEELNSNWLQQGENKVVFSIPKNANFQYQVKNVRLEFDVETNFNSELVLHTVALNYSKDNKIYIKGFIRNPTSTTKVLAEQTALNILNGEFEGFINLTKEIKERKFVFINAYDEKGVVGQQIVHLDNIIEADKIFEIEKSYPTVVSNFKAKTAGTLITEGAKLIINDSALITDKEISITKLRSVDIAPMGSGIVNVTKGGSAFRFLPDGTTFKKPVQIALEYDENLLPKGHSANEIKTFYFNTNTKKWIAIERDTIDKENKSILSSTTHFTDYINGIIQTPESPETAGFTPTMMSDIKAVDPSSEMTLISPPEVSQKGDANVSYPIKIPSGRNGLQPQLAIQYNSDGGNGWLGEGWGLSTPSITIDTKWGTPTFNPTKESEIYTMSGEQLMYPKHNGKDWMPNRHFDVDGAAPGTYSTEDIDRNPNLTFTPRKQGSFTKIERLGNSTSNYYWKATSTNGTVYWYGGKNNVNPNAVIKNDNGSIVHWGLFLIEDIHGNTIKYEYENFLLSGQTGQNANLNNGRIFRLKTIKYNGYNDANYKYEVIFNSATSIRQDASINARLGVKQIEANFLNTIEVKKVGTTEIIRKYVPRIGYGKFSKGQLKSIAELDKYGNLFYEHKFDYYDDISVDGTDVYFTDGVEEVICDEPCKDSDGDTVCDDEDPCPKEAGPVSNNGCPVKGVLCFETLIPKGHIFQECLINGVSVKINGNNLIGSPFYSINEIVTAMQLQHPVTTYDSSTNTLTISNTAINYINMIIYGNNGFDACASLTFKPCSRILSKVNNYSKYFSNLLQSNSFSLSEGIGLDSPCPDYLTNDDFLISGYMPSFDSSASLLGSSKSEAISGGFYMGIGIGGNRFTKMTTFGVQFNWGNDKSFGMTSLIDINGDGLDDIVSKEGGNLYYKKHIVTRTYNANNEPVVTHSFELKKPIIGINNFYRAFGRSSSRNFQITFGLKKVGGFVGHDKSKNNSETDVFFTDGNGDGLMDIVRDGVVYFNRLDANGNPSFIPDSQGTENLIITAAPKTIEVPDEYNEDEITLPAFDVVKVWEAPADGNIKIDNTIELTDTTKEAVVSVEMKKEILKCYESYIGVPKDLENVYLDNTLVNGSPYNLSVESQRILFKQNFILQFPTIEVVLNSPTSSVLIEFRTHDLIYSNSLIKLVNNNVITFSSPFADCGLWRISADDRTINPTTCNETPDGLCLLYGSQLNATNANVTNTLTTNCSGQKLAVKKGDRIYFRVHSVDNGNPPVNWNPKVEYTNTNFAAITDANGHNPFSSSYSDSFVLSNKLPTSFPGNSGTAKISWSPFTVNPTDTVTYQIIKETVAANESDNDLPPTIISSNIIYSQVCNPNVISTIAPSINLNNIAVTQPSGYEVNLQQTYFYFKVIATSNVDWKNSVWKPEMECTTVTPISPGDGAPTEGNLTSVIKLYPIPDYDLYRNFPCGVPFKKKQINTINNGQNLSVLPSLAGVFSSGDNGKVNFVVKRGTTFVGKRLFTITNGNATVDNSTAIPLGNTGATDIEIMFTVDDSNSDSASESLLKKIALTSNVLAKITYGTTMVNVPKSEIILYQKTNPRFGNLFRSWGQFMYNPDNATGALPTGISGTNLIKEEALVTTSLSQSQANQLNTDLAAINDNMSAADLANFEASHMSYINNIAFLPANPLREFIEGVLTDRWTGFHKENYASEFAFRAATLSQSMIDLEEGSENIEQAVLQTGAFAISKYAKGKSNNNFSAGVSAFGVGVNGSISNNGYNNAFTDYVDFNGDRYPDIVSTDKIQFTNKTGGLFIPINKTNEPVNTSSSDSFGFGATGSFGKNSDNTGNQTQLVRFEGFKGNAGAGISGNFTNGNSITSRFWTDINGDGLSDLVLENSGTTNVILNFGPTTPNAVSNNWGNLPIFKSKSNAISGGLGINKWNGSVEGGISLTTSWNKSTNTLIDINGDGLLDMIYADDDLGVKLNVGNKFIDKGIWTSNYNLKRESASVSATLNIGFTFAFVWRFPLIPIPFKIPALNFQTSPISTTTNKTTKSITDYDGDGYADLVEQINPTKIKIYHSRIRRTDKLKSVTNPLGGKFTIDYKVQPVDYDNPHAKWAMSQVIIEDGYDKVNDGVDVYKKNFVYEKGKYDRREREFYGYKTVKVEDYSTDDSGNEVIYRTSVTNYHNQSYFLNGLVENSYVIKGNDETKKYSKTINQYAIYGLNATNDEINLATTLPATYDVGGTEGRRSAAVLLKNTITELYELQASPQLTTEVSMKYDAKGRIVEYTNHGNVSDASDDYTSVIEYHNSMNALNIINVPKSIKVSTPTLGMVRERTTDVNSSNGTIVKINANNNDTWAETKMEYDQYGNLVYIQYPENTAGEAMHYKYTYDADYIKYVTKISDAFGYSSSATYDSNFDKPLEIVDLTGNKMIYKYDTFGRNTIILAPKEIQAGKPYTIKFEYYPYISLIPSGSDVTASTFVPVAVTSHYDQQNPTNDIQTFTFVDGMARPIQVKKDIYYNTGSASEPNFIEALSISGKTKFDEFGRSIEQFHPYWEPLENNTKFLVNEYDSPYKSTVIYDELDRPIKNIDPEGNESTLEYSIDTDVDGTIAIKTKTDVDQNGSQHVIAETFKDVSGRVISTNSIGGATGNIWTKFKYNEIGELIEYIDNEGIATTYKYDMFGRKIQVNHPDNGKTTYKYDNVNLISLQTANLESQGTTINYEYEINRLVHIKFPDLPSGAQNFANVTYKYGSSGNQTGRLIYQEDATGAQEMAYGNMGELTTNVRTVVGPNIPTRQFKTSFEYDSWNRLQYMQYPDGEKITYKYDLGGSLTQMTGELNGSPYDYIKRIDYDYFEQRTYLLYGNKTETFYNYTPSLRRLNNLNVKTSDGNDLFNNNYEFDKIGNVTSLLNTAGITANDMAGAYGHKFKYDEFNRLAFAEGYFEGSTQQIDLGNDANSKYGLKMEYNTTHGIVTKTQEHAKNGSPFMPNTYDNVYKYITDTHKVEAIVNNATGEAETFKYDANGNITVRNDNNSNRELFWDESNRLRVVSDNHSMQHYIYDGNGERVLKANSDMEAVYENGELVNAPGSVSINGYTSYPSAFIVITADGVYSKHYYAGSQRIVSRLGDNDASIFENGSINCKQEATENSFDDQKLKQAQIQDLNGFAEKAKKGTVTLKEYKPVSLEEQEKAMATDDNRAYAPPSGAGGLYYYHPDHLGTSTALTDFNGNTYQFFLNLPFGETMAQQLGSNYYNSPYKFNGKELDEETGFYYYGARYYDPKVSIWLSIDPLAEEFPNFNPYNYVMQNPLNLIDPTGMAPEEGGGDPKPNTHYPVIAVFGKKLDSAMQQRYDEAVSQGIPIIQVSGKKELATAMSELKKQGTSTNSYLIAQHGGKNSARIGDEKVNNKSDFTDLKDGFKGKNIILTHCNITRDSDSKGKELIRNLGQDSGANAVLSNDHLGWRLTDLQGKKDGRWGLSSSFPFIRREKGDGQYFNDYHISIKGKPAQQVYNAKVNLKTGTIIYNTIDNQTSGLRTPDMK